jgi:hypothetical protein
VAKVVTKVERLNKILQELQKRIPQLSALARGAEFVKLIKIAMGALGIEFVGFDIMDDNRMRGGRYIYFGIAANTDFIVDTVADMVVDAIVGFISSHQNLPLEGEVEKALFDLLAKLGVKDLMGRLKALLDLDLKPPFPFTPFTVASVPMANVFSIELDDLQGAFSDVREGGTLTVMFEDGIGAQRAANTAPPHIKLRTASTGISRRFGLMGVIAKGADIPHTS